LPGEDEAGRCLGARSLDRILPTVFAVLSVTIGDIDAGGIKLVDIFAPER
jgi:hypothetical protein